MTKRFQVLGNTGAVISADDEWESRVAAIRHHLRNHGVARGERVLAWLPRGWEEGALWQAVTELGAVWVSVPRRSTPQQVAGLLADAEPLVAVCAEGDLPRLEAGRWLAFGEISTAPDESEISENVGAIMADDLAALCYTSGSTGAPKGVMVSHGNLAGAVLRVESYLRHSPADRVLALMPLNSPWGLLQWLMLRRAGGSIVLPPAALMAAELVRTIREAEVTGLAGLPPTWVQLADYLSSRGETLPGLRYVTTSGGAVPQRILDLFPVVFPNAEIWMTYGLTEAFRTTVLPATEFAARKGSLGRPCDGVGVALLRPDGSRSELGEAGELVHFGDCVTLGYWRRPDDAANAFTLRAGHEEIFGNQRVHYSGDRVSTDSEGYLWFEGRDDGLIKTGGYRVSSGEIEEVLLRVPGIVHAVVGGVPDEALGQRVAAAVEITGDSGEISDAARALLRVALASHQQPQRLHIWPGTMPLNANGKLNRPEILAWLVKSETAET